MNKKGISPIIATVLLIGVAVALGAMVMTWTKDLAHDPCKEVRIEVYQSEQLMDPGVCYNSDNTIRLKIWNKGTIDVEQLRITTEMGIARSKVLANNLFEEDVPFSSVEQAKDNAWITIVPEVAAENNITTCNEQGTRIDKLLTPCP
ncbi:MAG: archaellin/type IV pilin N-terminal domain-containing protein [archaeon]